MVSAAGNLSDDDFDRELVVANTQLEFILLKMMSSSHVLISLLQIIFLQI